MLKTTVPTFSETLKRLRLEKNLSQEKIGQLLKCDRSIISRLENGEYEPSLQQVRAIAKLFQVSIEDLNLF